MYFHAIVVLHVFPTIGRDARHILIHEVHFISSGLHHQTGKTAKSTDTKEMPREGARTAQIAKKGVPEEQ